MADAIKDPVLDLNLKVAELNKLVKALQEQLAKLTSDLTHHCEMYNKHIQGLHMV